MYYEWNCKNSGIYETSLYVRYDYFARRQADITTLINVYYLILWIRYDDGMIESRSELSRKGWRNEPYVVLQLYVYSRHVMKITSMWHLLVKHHWRVWNDDSSQVRTDSDTVMMRKYVYPKNKKAKKNKYKKNKYKKQ